MREELSNLEHEQWMSWSKSIDKQLFKPRDNLPIAYPEHIGKNFIEKKDKWLKLWKPYDELTEEEKDQDRIFADKVLVLIEEKVKKLKEGINDDWEFCKKAKAEPHLHPRRILELIDKVFALQDGGEE